MVGVLFVFFFAAGYGFGIARKNQAALGSAREEVSKKLSGLPVGGSVRPEARGADRFGGWLSLCAAARQPGDWKALMRGARGDRFAEELVMARWAQADAAACWAFLLESREGDYPSEELARIVAKIWAANDAEAAMAAMVQLPKSAPRNSNRYRDSMRWLVLREALRHDMEGALKLVSQTLDARGIGYGDSDRWVKADPEKACKLLADLPPCLFRNAIGQAAQEWFVLDPDAALEFVKGLPAGSQNVAAEYIGRVLVGEMKDFDRARELAESARSMALRQRITGSFVRQWGEEAPGEAAAWVAGQFRGEVLVNEMKSALGGAAFRVITTHQGEGAFDFGSLQEVVDAQPVGFARNGAASAVLKTWGNREPAAAFDWYLEKEQRGELGERALWSLSDNFAGAAGAREWMKTAPEHPFVNAVFRSLVHGFQSGDALREWAKELPPERAVEALKAAEAKSP